MNSVPAGCISSGSNVSTVSKLTVICYPSEFPKRYVCPSLRRDISRPPSRCLSVMTLFKSAKVSLRNECCINGKLPVLCRYHCRCSKILGLPLLFITLFYFLLESVLGVFLLRMFVRLMCEKSERDTQGYISGFHVPPILFRLD